MLRSSWPKADSMLFVCVCFFEIDHEVGYVGQGGWIWEELGEEKYNKTYHMELSKDKTFLKDSKWSAIFIFQTLHPYFLTRMHMLLF